MTTIFTAIRTAAFTLGLAAIGATALTVTTGVIAPSVAEAAEVNGRNVGVVRFAKGSFEQRPNNRWVEFDASGTKKFNFRETGRDDWSVYIKDVNRNLTLQLDLHRKEVIYNGQKLYSITGVAASKVAGRPSKPSTIKLNVEAGPIWNQGDAQNKCKALASKNNAKWTGQWVTTVQGEMSVCQLELNASSFKVAVEAGPIWNQGDAQGKCKALASKHNVKWTGQWWTTVQGKMSVCQLSS